MYVQSQGQNQRKGGIPSIAEDVHGEALSAQQLDAESSLQNESELVGSTHSRQLERNAARGGQATGRSGSPSSSKLPTQKVLPLFLDKFDQVEAELKNLRRQIDQLQVKGMTEEFHYAESMKGVLTTKEEFTKLESDLYRSDALNDKRYAELTGKVAELLQKAAAGPPGTQGYDKFVTDMLETKIKKLIAWQQEQYEVQEQDENFKQNQTRFVNRLAQTMDEAQQKLLSH